MALVAWILALVGAVLALALCAGSAGGLTRRIDRTSAMAVMSLPLMAVYFTANDLLALVQAERPPDPGPSLRRRTIRNRTRLAPAWGSSGRLAAKPAAGIKT